MITIAIGAVSDTGRLRAANEDSYLVEPRLLAVADGMGGHNAGEIASAMAVQLLRNATTPTMGNQGITSSESFIATAASINTAIYSAATASSAQRGMGTTLTALAITPPNAIDTDECVVVVNVGDSRTYLIRAGELRQISVDHSYVQELVSEGIISTDDARTHPRRNIVTRALGIDPMVSVDAWTLPIIDGDRYVLCSDGLVDEISNEDILSIVMENPDPQIAAAQLVAAANNHGARDNVTVIVADIRQSDSISAQAPHNLITENGGVVKRVVTLLVVALVSVSLFVGLYHSRQGYFVAFDSNAPDAVVVIYKGSSQQILWFGPTKASTSDITRTALLAALVKDVEAHPRFSSLRAAATYIKALRATQVTNG